MRTFALFSLLILLPGVATAQTAMLRGRVVDRADGQPLAGATVEVAREGLRTGAATDAAGFFIVAGLRPGRYALRVSFLGYTPFEDTLSLDAEGAMLDVALRAEARQAGEVVVESAPELLPEADRLVRVRPAEVRAIPTLTPAPDLAAYLTALPGFVPTGEQGGQVSVRGGEPAHNLFLVDGIPLYQPFHVLGELSVVPGDALAFADVYAGAFPARYGGRISSVVDVTLRGGDKQRFRADVSAAPLLSAVQIEGPLVPGRVSAIVSARTSLADRVGIGLAREPLPFQFGDALARVHAYLSQTSSLGITALGSRDRAELRTALGAVGVSEWQSEGVGARFSYLPITYAVLAEIEVFFTRLDSRFRAPSQTPRRSLVEEGGGNFGFRYLLGRSEVHFGLQARTDHLLATTGAEQAEEYLTEGALYLDGVFRGGRFSFYPGFRLATFPSRSRVLFEPRVRAEWQGERHRFHAGAAAVHQEIGGRYTSNDLSDVFVSWVPVPEGAALPRARQVVGGWSTGGARTWVSLDAYHRALSGLGTEGTLRGVSRGAEVRAQAARGPVVLRMGAALAAVRYRADTLAYPPPTDRPLRLDAEITGRRAGWEASARWYAVSGAAFTPLRGAYRDVPLRPGTIPDSPGVLVSSDGVPGSRRLPPTHRVDLLLAYTRALGPARLSLQVAVRNALDRANLFYLNRLTGERYDGLPRVLSVGARLEV